MHEVRVKRNGTCYAILEKFKKKLLDVRTFLDYNARKLMTPPSIINKYSYETKHLHESFLTVSALCQKTVKHVKFCKEEDTIKRCLINS